MSDIDKSHRGRGGKERGGEKGKEVNGERRR